MAGETIKYDRLLLSVPTSSTDALATAPSGKAIGYPGNAFPMNNISSWKRRKKKNSIIKFSKLYKRYE